MNLLINKLLNLNLKKLLINNCITHNVVTSKIFCWMMLYIIKKVFVVAI